MEVGVFYHGRFDMRLGQASASRLVYLSGYVTLCWLFYISICSILCLHNLQVPLFNFFHTVNFVTINSDDMMLIYRN